MAGAASTQGIEKLKTQSTISGFADEVSATAPIRELPEDLDKQQRSFVDLLDGVYHIVHEPDMLGNVIRSIMIELKNNPEYRKLVSPTDVHTMIKGMRSSMGLARIKKAESASKRRGGGSKTTKVDADMLSDLDALGALDLGD